jgi:hypothetical protein
MYCAETRESEIGRFENCRIALAVTLKFILSKVQEFPLNLMSPLVQLWSCNTNNVFSGNSRNLKNEELEIVGILSQNLETRRLKILGSELYR